MSEFAQNAIEQDEELTPEVILMNEDDILAGILECAGNKSSDEAYTTIEIRVAGSTRRMIRYDDTPVKMEAGEKVLIRFRIRGLDQDEYNKCETGATKYVTNKKLGGIKMATDMNRVQFFDSLIYKATHPTDREKLWDNQAAWKKLNGVLTGTDMVSKLLFYGEKNAVVEIIDEKSGFKDDNLTMEEVSKK